MRSSALSLRTRSAALAAALCATACSRAPELSGAYRGAGLVLVSIDTLRADRLGCYGYERPTSPRLDELAGESVLFEEFYATSPKTASSHMSLFTSLLPTAHGVHNVALHEGVEMDVMARNRATLPQVLARAGYRCAAVTNGGNLNPLMGFQRGFREGYSAVLEDVSAVVDRALRTLDELQRTGAPPFLFVHTYQVHAPYLPPEPFRSRFCPPDGGGAPPGRIGRSVAALADLPFAEQWKRMHQAFWGDRAELDAGDAAYLSDLYDGEIAYTDSEIGRLFDGLRSRGVLDSALVVVLSDHGEEFLEHGDWEHDQLYREHLHVPLIVRLPDRRLAGRRVAGLASGLDLMPTLLDLLGLATPATAHGRSLVPALEAGATDDAPVVSERLHDVGDYRASLQSRDQRVVFRAREGALELYDTRADPGELRDLGRASPAYPQATAELRERLEELFALREQLDRGARGERAPVDDAARAELEQLGYAGEGEREPAGGLSSPLSSWPDDGGE